MQEKDKQLTTIMEEKNKLMDELKETVTKEDLLGTVSFSLELFSEPILFIYFQFIVFS